MDALSDLNTGLFSVLGAGSPREDEIFANWFANDQSHPLLIMKGADPVGFALVSRPRIPAAGEASANYHMSEFFVRKPHRRMGIGRDAATLIFDRFAGEWEIVEYLRNPGAVTFWRRVLSGYADGRFYPNARATARCDSGSTAGPPARAEPPATRHRTIPALKSFALRSMQGVVTAAQPDNPSNVGFEFIRTLAAELSAGKVDIPSFPEVAVRVRRVLADPKSSVEQVVRVVGSEPALAARLLRIANSASLNRSGRVVADLRTAINRIGYNMVRSASISFAMAQIRRANQLAGLEHHLDALWQRSTRVAAFAHVLARSCSRINADEALLCGMMHGIGELYVLTRAAEHPELFVNGTTLDGIIADWQASIGKAILENWEFSEEMALAVGEQHGPGRTDPGAAPDLGDIIAVAVLLGAPGGDPPPPEHVLRQLPAARRLGLDGTATERVMRDCAEEVAALSNALGG